MILFLLWGGSPSRPMKPLWPSSQKVCHWFCSNVSFNQVADGEQSRLRQDRITCWPISGKHYQPSKGVVQLTSEFCLKLTNCLLAQTMWNVRNDARLGRGKNTWSSTNILNVTPIKTKKANKSPLTNDLWKLHAAWTCCLFKFQSSERSHLGAWST